VPVSPSIKNVPDDVARRLRERSLRNHRSLQKELLTIIEDAVAPQEEITVQELHEYVRSLGLQTADDSSAILREDRDSR